MKNKYIFTAVLLVVLTAIGAGIIKVSGSPVSSAESKELKVVTSFYPIYIAAKNVIRETDGVVLENLTEPKTGCLHDYQLTPADLVELSTADLFLVNGGGIESFLDDVVDNYPELPIVTASEGIAYLEADEGTQTIGHDHDHGEHDSEEGEEDAHAHDSNEGEADPHAHDSAEIEPDAHAHDLNETAEDTHDHGDVNAHVWMDVNRYKQEVENIAAALSEADPTHAGDYAANAEVYLGKLDALKEKLETLKGPADNRKIIIFHDSFAYFADAFGLEIAYIIDMDENTSLSANEVSQLIELVKTEHIDMLFAEEQYGTKIADAVSRETGANVYVLDSLVTGEDDYDSYINGMEANLEQLEKAFGEEE